jgi:predicted nucleotidyltransferase component of viral defense system
MTTTGIVFSGELMNAYSPKASVELFHLLILDLLGRKVDRKHYALKGGCNLRFFMKSIRYSQDMDLDVRTVPKEKIREILDRIIESNTLKQLLEVNGIAIQAWSAPKQTDTTQRWKFTLSVSASDAPHPTRLEFSRRGMREGLAFEPVDAHLIGSYRLFPIMANHYDRETTILQKIEALATRRVTQARDVFDLHLLLTTGVAEIPGPENRRHAEVAKANALSVTFEQFKGQVLSYLHPDYQEQYDSAALWEDMVLRVVEALEGAGA